jgi:spermidine/putrescine transport system ATP-binding protein
VVLTDIEARPGPAVTAGHIQVSLRHVSRAFGDVKAVDDVSIDIERGTFVSLLGPSGCGKTTLLRITIGLERPDSGRVFINGTDVTDAPPNKRPAGLVFQHGALFPHMTVAGNVAYGLRRKGWKSGPVRDRVHDMLRLVQLEGLEERRPSQLSGGQARRVGLARALATSPEVLLLDEPLSALDLKLRKEMELQLRRIHREVGTTFVYVTHDQEEALVMSQRIVVMRAGRIVQDATPREIYRRPSSVFVAGFIGQTNLVTGRVSSLLRDRADIVLPGGERVVASTEGIAVSDGDEVTLSIRPELVTMGSAPAPDTTGLEGAIEEAIYLGDHVRVKVRTQGGTEIWCHAPIDHALDEIGLRITIAWRVGDALVLAHEDDGVFPDSLDPPLGH